MKLKRLQEKIIQVEKCKDKSCQYFIMSNDAYKVFKDGKLLWCYHSKVPSVKEVLCCIEPYDVNSLSYYSSDKFLNHILITAVKSEIKKL